MPGNLHAVFSTARIANVPSVVGNVLLGFLPAHLLAGGDFDPASLQRLALAACSGICLYLGGNFLNDFADRDWDAKHRPERALPSGRFTRRSYAVTAAALLAAGGLLSGFAGSFSAWVAILILLGIAVYTLLHKRTAWAVLAMGACRGGLVWLGAAAAVPDHFPGNAITAGASAAVFLYILSLSLRARCESGGQARPGSRFLACLGFLLVPACMLPAAHAMNLPLGLLLAGILPYVIWLKFSGVLPGSRSGPDVSRLLAGIPLVDWLLLLPLALAMAIHAIQIPWPAAIAALLFPPLTVVAAIALQRLAPAT